MRSRIRKGRFFTLFMVLLMALTVSATALAQGKGPQDFSVAASSITQTSQYSLDIPKINPAARAASSDKLSVFVKLKGDSLSTYQGGVPGLAATSPRARGEAKLNLHSSDSVRYRDHLREQRDSFKARARRAAPSAAATHDFDIILNGVSLIIDKDQVGALASLPEVAGIYRDEMRQPETDRTPQFINAPIVWNQLGGQASAGEDVIVGVLDTGIWPEHPSFSDPDPLGKPYAAPPPPLSGTRACKFTGGANPGPAFSCNNKLIGADRFMTTYESVVGLAPGEFTTARDDDGHGTHTSSTAAGNRGVQASIFGIPRGIISGIAPRAHVIMYKVCGIAGCFQTDSAAAVQKAIQDGVNVINFSIGGGANPYADTVEQAFLQAFAAGVFVAASAGNSGPAPDTTDHRGPWVTTVAASTADRAFTNIVTLSGGSNTLSLKGTSLTAGISTPKQVVVPTGDAFCIGPFAPGTFTNKIVVCERGGGPGRVQKGFNVLQGGAVGMILYNNAANVTDQETDNHFLPATHIQFSAGQQVLAFLTANPGTTATLTAGITDTQQGDVMASFSSRGGPGQTLGISKPDVTAPGVQILAGHTPQSVDIATGPQGELFQAIAGTSMSSPHVAGAAALLKDLHPTWTPSQIKSAIMTTASTAGLVKEDGVTPYTPFDAGSGRLDLRKAWDPGLTFNETAANYITLQNQLWNANYPSLYVPVMPGVITVPRTAHNEVNVTNIWRLSSTSPSDVKIIVPIQISLPPGGDTTFNITVDARNVPIGQVRHAMLFLDDGHGKLHFPITIVRNQPAITLDKTCDPANINHNQNTTCTITMFNGTFDNAPVNMVDVVPSFLQVVHDSVTGGATLSGNTVTFNGTLAGASPPNPSIAPGSSPAGGYLPLSLFGITPIAGVGDDTLTNFTVPAFTYAGETYTSIGISSNGYLVIGGGNGPDNSINNQNFPDPIRPNNVLSGFWTDLNPGVAGTIRIGTLTDGVDTWIVVDWNAVREFSTGSRTHSFEMWLGINGDANPGEDISFAYGANTGNGDLGFASVGVENRFGNRGNNTYFNGVGTLPTNGTQLQVASTAGAPGETKVITFQAKGINKGKWQNCAELTSPNFFGTSTSCFNGKVNN